jgi:hypothetical protein
MVVLVAVLLALTLGGGSDPVASSPAATSTPGATADFLATLPADFVDCRQAETAGDGDTMAASCGAARSQPGPTGAQFFLYPDLGTLDGVFTADVAGGGLSEFADGQDCSTGAGYTSWSTDGGPGGQVGCAILDDGSVMVAWTDEEHLIEGVVTAAGSTQADLAALFDWWEQKAFFRG